MQCYSLSTVFRQRDDHEFIRLLGEVRKGQPLRQDVLDALNACAAPLKTTAGSASSTTCNTGGGGEQVVAGNPQQQPPPPLSVEATRLYCKNIDADSCNTRALHRLAGPRWLAVAEDCADADPLVPR